MHKFHKIAISILLIISVFLNPLASVFDIRAGAVATAAGFGTFFVDFIIEQIIFQTGNQMWQTAINDPTGVYNSAKLSAFSNFENFVTAPDVIQVNYDIYPDEFGNPSGSYKPIGVYLDETKILTDEQRDAYQLIVDTCNDYLASGGNSDLIFYQVGDAYGFDAIGYAELKKNLNNQFISNMADNGIIDLGKAGVLPVYDFSFVGPQPQISTAVTQGTTTLMKDGFVFTPPVSSVSFDDQGRTSTELTVESMYGYSIFETVKVSGNDENGYIASASFKSYGYSYYILYDGVLYYYTARGYVDSPVSSTTSSISVKTLSKTVFYSADGKCLADVYSAGATYQFGYAINTSGEVKSGAPVTTFVGDSDFTTTSGGTAEVPRTKAEEIIRKALELGLAVPDSLIQFAEDGSVTSVDGIEINKLQELIDAVNAGNLGFENMQQYLDLITQLVSAGNLTASQQKTILDNINSKSVAISEDISAIREAIESMVAEDEEVVANNDFDIETPDSIIDKFPFCLPFDIYTVYNLLSAPPIAPQFEIPFEMEGYFDYSIDVDLSEFEMVATIVRWFLYIIFIIGLILVTNKLIGRG